ncbi:hypothetical protein HD554DRAFT_2131797 [Boletus coccyginus]|nr:hypothetical protein HD554DRAFT_2131797 [Boletus coccyginus]
MSSSSIELPASLTQQTSPSISPLHLSRDSSQMSGILHRTSDTSRHISFPRGVPRVPQSRTPRIQIPPHRSPQSSSKSPITSSPEEPEVHYGYRYVQPAETSPRSNSLVTPVSVSPPEFSLSPISCDQKVDAGRRSSHGLVSPPPSGRIQVPRPRSQRSIPCSSHASSSDESDLHRGRYRSMSQPIRPMSPGHRRGTPPKTIAPDVPLPPIPSDDQGVDSDSSKSKKSKSLSAEQPPTPMRSHYSYSPTPARPLPVQPVPSPVPDSDESEPTDSFCGSSLRQNWQASNGELPLDVVVRQDSPVYMFRDDHASPTNVGPPPAYLDQRRTYSPSDTPTYGNSLDRVIDECGGSPKLRLVVSKCVKFQRGYEPPYWQTCLQACGVDEMCKQVDWAASSQRAV